MEKKIKSIVLEGEQVTEEVCSEVLENSDSWVWEQLVNMFEYGVQSHSPLTAEQTRHLLNFCVWLVYGGRDPSIAEAAVKNSPISDGGRCNRVWLDNHVAYRCKDCGTTESSCMCVDCFDPQQHEGHDFRLYKSVSGGCCDCGDKNAWNPSGYCKKHRVRDFEGEDILDLLDSKMRRGAFIVLKLLCFELIMCIVDSLNLVELSSLPKTYSALDICRTRIVWFSAKMNPGPTESITTTCTVFVEIRVRMALSIIETLIHLCEICPPFRRLVGNSFKEPVSVQSTEFIPLHALLVYGIFVNEDLQKQIGVLYLRLLIDESFKQSYTSTFVLHYGYLVDKYLFGTQAVRKCVMDLLDRILCQLCNSDEQVGKLVTGKSNDMLGTIVSRILLLAKKNSVLRRFDIVTRNNMAEETDSNPQQFSDDIPTTRPAQNGRPQPNDVRARVLLSQFTPATGSPSHQRRPRKLGPDGGFPPAGSQPGVSLNRIIDCNSEDVKNRLFDRLVMDLRLLLLHSSVVEHIILYRKEVMVDALEIMSLLQEMNLQVRECETHIPYDRSKDWETAFVLELDLAWAMFRIIDGLNTSLEKCHTQESKLGIVKQVFGPATDQLVKWMQGQGLTAIRFMNQSIEMTQDVSNVIVASLTHKISSPSYMTSIHIPLHRFWAGLFRASLAQVCTRVPLCDFVPVAPFAQDRDRDTVEKLLGPNAIPKGFSCFVAEHPLRVFVKMAQNTAKVWIRNGIHVFRTEVQYYLSKAWSGSGFDMDLFILQYAASTLDGHTFLRMLANRFELSEFFSYKNDFQIDLSDRENEGNEKPSKYLSSRPRRLEDRTTREKMSNEQAAYVAEYFFRFVGILVHDRTAIGETAQETVRKQVIHALASGQGCRRSFSAIEAHIHTSLLEHLKVEDILEEVAIYNPPTRNDAEGSYSLRDHLWFEEIDIYFSHFTPEELHAAEENYRMIHRRKRKRRETSIDFQIGEENDGMVDRRGEARIDLNSGSHVDSPGRSADQKESSLLDLIKVRKDGHIYDSFAHMPFRLLWNPELHGYIFRALHACIRKDGVENALSSPGIALEALRLLYQAVDLSKETNIVAVYENEVNAFLESPAESTPGTTSSPNAGRRKRANSWDGVVSWEWPRHDLQLSMSLPDDARMMVSASINHRVDRVHHSIRLPFSNPILNCCELVPFSTNLADDQKNDSKGFVEAGGQKDWNWPLDPTISQTNPTTAFAPFPLNEICPHGKGDECIGLSIFMLLLQIQFENRWEDQLSKLVELIIQDVIEVMRPLKPGLANLKQTFDDYFAQKMGSSGSTGAGKGTTQEQQEHGVKPKKNKKNKKQDSAGAEAPFGKAKNKMQAKIMAKFAKRQAAFLHLNSVDENEADVDDVVQTEGFDLKSRMDIDPGSPKPANRVRANSILFSESATVECSLCRESEVETKSLGMVAFAAVGSVEHAHDIEQWLGQAQLAAAEDSVSGLAGLAAFRQSVSSRLQNQQPSFILNSSIRSNSTVIFKGCGHYMHEECLTAYQRTLSRNTVLSPGEFQCPICRSMANVVIPLVTVREEASSENQACRVGKGGEGIRESSDDADQPEFRSKAENSQAINRFFGHTVPLILSQTSTVTGPLGMEELSILLAENLRFFLCGVNIGAEGTGQGFGIFQAIFNGAMAYSELHSDPFAQSRWTQQFESVVDLYSVENVFAKRNTIHIILEACLMANPVRSRSIRQSLANAALAEFVFALALGTASKPSSRESHFGGISESAGASEACLSWLFGETHSDFPTASLPGADLTTLFEGAVTLICQSLTDGQECILPKILTKFVSERRLKECLGTSTNAAERQRLDILGELGPFFQCFNVIQLALTTRNQPDSQDWRSAMVPVDSFNVHEWIGQEGNFVLDLELVRKVLDRYCLIVTEIVRSMGQQHPVEVQQLALMAVFPRILPFFRAEYPELVKLPEVHSKLYLRFCTAGTDDASKCATCSSPFSAEQSMICLQCGHIFCTANNCLNHSFSLVSHSTNCPRSVFRGIAAFLPSGMTMSYLIIDKNRIVDGGSIYLDSHGEVDPSLHRGKPMYLSLPRMNQVRKFSSALFFTSHTKLIRRVAWSVNASSRHVRNNNNSEAQNNPSSSAPAP